MEIANEPESFHPCMVICVHTDNKQRSGAAAHILSSIVGFGFIVIAIACSATIHHD